MSVRRRNRAIVLGAAGLFVALATRVAAAPPGVPSSPPTITVDKPVHDFGTVEEGPPVRHLFKVRNSGGGPLEIKSVSASCGCTAAALRDKLIAPGKSGEIEVSFDTSGRQGKNEKTVTVISNDPRTPTLTLVIRVQVELLLGMDPAYTYLQSVAGEQPRAEVWLSGKLAPKAKLTVAKVDPADILRIEVIERAARGGKQRGLRLGLAQQKPGDGSVRLTLATGVPARPQVEHTVHWSLPGNLEVPRSVHLDLGQAGQRERTLQVTSRRKDFLLGNARVTEGPFQVTVEPGAAGGPRTLKVRTTLTAAPPAHTKGKLLLETNDPLEPTREVDLSLAALRRSVPVTPR